MITDDELLLYYYRDGLDAAERARIGAAREAEIRINRDKCGAGGGSRTHMPFGRSILSRLRLPFRHTGAGSI